MEKKFEVSVQNFTYGKALSLIIYVVLCNVQYWVSWLCISKNEEK